MEKVKLLWKWQGLEETHIAGLINITNKRIAKELFRKVMDDNSIFNINYNLPGKY
jgi:hypothetical protein